MGGPFRPLYHRQACPEPRERDAEAAKYHGQDTMIARPSSSAAAAAAKEMPVRPEELERLPSLAI